MSNISNFPRWRNPLFAVLTAVAGVGHTIAPVSAHEHASAAKLHLLDGPVAAQLTSEFSPSVPVLVAGAGSDVLAVAFAEDKNNFADLLKELFITVPVEGCTHDSPVRCCVAETDTPLLSVVTTDGRSGWLKIGNKCGAKPDENEEELVNYITTPTVISDALRSRFGIDHCLNEISDSEGYTSIIVNAPSRDSARWKHCVSDTDEIADDFAKLIRGWVSKTPPTHCRKIGGWRCADRDRHWFSKSNIPPKKWSQSPYKCSC